MFFCQTCACGTYRECVCLATGAQAAGQAPASGTGGKSYYQKLAMRTASNAAAEMAQTGNRSILKTRPPTEKRAESAGPGSATGILDADFNEDDSHASFLDALNEWRNGGQKTAAAKARPQTGMQTVQTESSGASSRPLTAVHQPSKLSYYEKVRMRNASAAAGFAAVKQDVPPSSTSGRQRPPSAAWPSSSPAAEQPESSTCIERPSTSSSRAPAAVGKPDIDIDELLNKMDELEIHSEVMARTQLARLGEDAAVNVCTQSGGMIMTSKTRLPDNVMLPSQ